MRIDTPNYSVTLSIEELERIAGGGRAAMKIIRGQVERAAETVPPRLTSTTIARPRINTKQACPKCGLLMESRGLGVHFHRRHHQKYADYLKRHDGNRAVEEAAPFLEG